MTHPTPYEAQQAIMAGERWPLAVDLPHGLYTAVWKAADVIGGDPDEFILRVVTPALHAAIGLVGVQRIIEQAESEAASYADHEDNYGSLNDINSPRLRNRVATDNMKAYLKDRKDALGPT